MMMIDPIVAKSAIGLSIGMWNTVQFCAIASVIGLALGFAIAFARMAPHRLLRWPAAAFVELFRNTPFLVQAFIVYFGLAELGLRLNASFAGVVVLALYASANFSESIRSAIASVPGGQAEAARSLGFRPRFTMVRIILPQAIGYLLPALSNQLIGLIKDSAALSVITVPEVAMAAQVIIGETFAPVETYAVVALMYWAVTSALVWAISGAELYWTRWSRDLPQRAKRTVALRVDPER